MTLPLLYVILLHHWTQARQRGDQRLAQRLDEALRAIHAAHLIERGR